jgi:hypothetical protein
MPTLASKLGIRLILLLGQKAPEPAPAEVMTALQRVEVENNIDGEDGFQLSFTVGKGRRGEFGLLRSGALDPDTRVVIGVLLGARLHPLIDGVIYYEQLRADKASGSFHLTVMGRGIGAVLASKVQVGVHANESSSDIVRKIISSRYTTEYGIVGLDGISETDDRASEQQRTPSQNDTDLTYIKKLARRNGFIFYIEPETLGTTKVYWGPADRRTAPLPSLVYEMGSASNTTDLDFSHDAQAPFRVEGDTIAPDTKMSQKIQAPTRTPGLAVARPTPANRTVRLPNAARLTPAEAQVAAAAMEEEADPAVTARGSLDTVRYGDVLRAHRVVGVRGAGLSYDGDYLIRRVIHEIETGKYVQRFYLGRKGLEASN